MRILALGQPLPDPLIDNYNWASAPSFFDYDAIIKGDLKQDVILRPGDRIIIP